MKIFYQYNLKILALISAILLWFIVITVENNVVKYPEPIDIQVIGQSEYYALSSPLPQATVYLKMDADELKSITKSEIKVFIDLSLIAEGTHTVDISATVDGLKSKVLKVEPANITVTLSAVLAKEVPLKLILTGQPNEDFIIKSSKISPETVKISGAKSIIDTIKQIEIPYTLTGNETAGFEREITIDLATITNQPLVSIDQPVVTLTVALETKNAQKEVNITPVFIREEDRSTLASRLKIEPKTVLIQGLADTINEIDSIGTNPLEVSALLRNKSVDVKLNLPQGVTLVNPNQKVTLKLQ